MVALGEALENVSGSRNGGEPDEQVGQLPNGAG